MNEPLTVAAIPPAVQAAYTRTQDYLRRTPLVRSAYFSARTAANVYFKYESLQVSGSFKARGAFSKLTLLSDAERARGVVTASSGNHGAAVAYAVGALGGRGLVFVPENASPAKVSAIRALGAEVRFHATDSGQTELHARAHAAARGVAYIPPYNDPAIVAGQGTIALELVEQLDPIDEILVSVGGGGLLSGIAGYLRGRGSKARVVACSAANDHAMHAAQRAGRVVDCATQPTIADGCAGGIESDTITLPILQAVVDEWTLISEEATIGAMREFIENESQLLEGSAGLAIAALLAGAARDPERYRGRNVVIVICGSRISLAALSSVLGEPPAA